MTRVGVFALQGDVREHLEALRRLGVDAIAVRRPAELDTCAALVLPGGESTTMAKLARTFELFDPIYSRIEAGMPVLGTCAGMVLLANRLLDGAEGQQSFGGIDITVRRNAFGRQVDSFEAEVDFRGEGPMPGVFIRAPWVEEVGAGVEVLARIEHGAASGRAAGRIVAVQQGTLMATSFHPEISSGVVNEDRIQRAFLELVS